MTPLNLLFVINSVILCTFFHAAFYAQLTSAAAVVHPQDCPLPSTLCPSYGPTPVVETIPDGHPHYTPTPVVETIPDSHTEPTAVVSTQNPLPPAAETTPVTHTGPTVPYTSALVRQHHCLYMNEFAN